MSLPKDQIKLPWGVLPRGLTQAQAAIYLGISPSKFITEVRAGRLPKHACTFGKAKIWDRLKLDALFDPEGDKASPEALWDEAFDDARAA